MTVFFLIAVLHWKTSMNVGALVTLVAVVHYVYMFFLIAGRHWKTSMNVGALVTTSTCSS